MDNDNRPVISVIVPVYNVGEDYLANLFKYASDDTGLVINRFIVFRDSVSGDSSMILPLLRKYGHTPAAITIPC